MAVPYSYNSPQGPVEEVASPTTQNQANSGKLYSQFLLRPLFIAIFIALLPLFPPEAPDFISQSILTRSWELLHLLFIGIAVSYGLFSRRNIEFDEESNQLKFDNCQSYMSRILEVSSIFDDEIESLSSGVDRNKIQTWNSQYFRGESMVMVTKERSSVGSCSRISHGDSDKPLRLPVRSLKLRASVVEESDSDDGTEGFSISANGSGLPLDGSSVSYKIGNGSVPNSEEKLKESDLLSLPRRSQSGRVKFENEAADVEPLSYSYLSSANAIEFASFGSPCSHSLIHQSPRHNSSSSPSPKKRSPASSPSPELHPKNWEDFGKTNEKQVHKPAPPSPPVRMPVCAESPPCTANSNPVRDRFLLDKKDMRSFRDKVKDLSRDSKDGLPTDRDFGVDSLGLETKPRRHVGKSVRTIRSSKYAQEVKKCRDNVNQEKTGERISEEVDGNGVEKTGARIESLNGIEEPNHHVHFHPPRRNHQKESPERMIEVSKDSDSNYSHESSEGEVSAMGSCVEAEANANEVDKKADEFIAKFREQIRLQRVEAIKRSRKYSSKRDAH